MYYFIPPRHFHQIRMNSPIGNHPSQTFLSNQDAYRRRKTFCPQKAFWQSCAPEAHVSVSANKPRSQLPPISPRSQLPPESSCLSFANKPKPQFRQYPPASVSARKLRIHLCLDGKHNSRELPDAVIVHAADGNRYGKCISRPAIQ